MGAPPTIKLSLVIWV